jgi:hypothetical protein
MHTVDSVAKSFYREGRQRLAKSESASDSPVRTTSVLGNSIPNRVANLDEKGVTKTLLSAAAPEDFTFKLRNTPKLW